MLALLDKPAYYIAGLTAEILPPAERWAIALSSMYTRINGGSDERLMPCSFFRAYQSTLMLQHSWEVNGRTGAARHEQAIKLLEWLAREGHRATLADPGDREAMQDLLAWDIARDVMVARHATVRDISAPPRPGRTSGPSPRHNRPIRRGRITAGAFCAGGRAGAPSATRPSTRRWRRS
jgi:hypothetical protein